jgi:POT family proton-dependent oligopeptide transporter
VYLSTVLGGWIADRLLGMERTVFYGGVVVMCGHIALAIVPGLAGVAVGLVLVVLGSGALKANASSLLGTLYEKGDARCDGGFTLFYLGINLGAFIGPLITGLLQTRAGFHYGFGAAAIGMALGSRSTSRSGATWALMATLCQIRCRAARLAGLLVSSSPWW